MKDPHKKIFQFEENPEIKDIIKILKQAESLGYTRVKPFMVDGDYKQEEMDSEKLLRICLI